MKTDEAPEKIYADPKVFSISDEFNELLRTKEDDYVEYTRTDVFIDKACDYLQKNLWRIIFEENEFRQRFVTDFKYYMKGE